MRASTEKVRHGPVRPADPGHALAGVGRVDGEVRITKRIDGDPSWLNGPPYAVEEVVFDENELLGCFRTEAELLADGGDE
jgi:hypothetical protein